MTAGKFKLATWLAKQCQSPRTAFSILIALTCMRQRMTAHELCDLLQTDITCISAAAKRLEELGVLTRHWTKSKSTYPQKHNPKHGRAKEYMLLSNWEELGLMRWEKNNELLKKNE